MKIKSLVKTILHRAKIKYRVVVSNNETFEEKFSFRLTGMILFTIIGAGTVFLVVITTLLIAFTPLREYIPGYVDEDLLQTSYRNGLATDSLTMEVEKQALMIASLQRVFSGEDLSSLLPTDTARIKGNYDTLTLTHALEDSMLRIQVEKSIQTVVNSPKSRYNISPPFFQTPVRGNIAATFNRATNHFGVDIISEANTPVLSVLDGTVLSAEWTPQTGYTLILIHAEGMISVYKYCSALLKAKGDSVKVGEPIGFVGPAEKYTIGYCLHFELWYNGIPVDPREYLLFE